MAAWSWTNDTLTVTACERGSDGAMARTTYTCDGCGADLRSKRDLEKEQGQVYSSWNCSACGTSVPGVVAEKIRHQKQH